ncbi:MAG: hypothetical protein IJO56_06505 [Oscillospiraceae bacterium]|nr:hypothetical protein [Oscillospiraceae bacterium]
MLFRKKIQRSCAYCVHSTKLDTDTVLCVKHGVVLVDKNCRKFEYDPCKRVPAKQKTLDFHKYDEEDYTL